MFYRIVVNASGYSDPFEFQILCPNGMWLPYPKRFNTSDAVHGFAAMWCGMKECKNEVLTGWDS